MARIENRGETTRGETTRGKRLGAKRFAPHPAIQVLSFYSEYENIAALVDMD